MDKYPNCDIGLCSFEKLYNANTDREKVKEVQVKTNEMMYIEKLQKQEIYKGAIVWRKAMLNLMRDTVFDLSNIKEFLFKCVINHFNAFSFSQLCCMVVVRNKDYVTSLEEDEAERIANSLKEEEVLETLPTDDYSETKNEVLEEKKEEEAKNEEEASNTVTETKEETSTENITIQILETENKITNI
jgi:hypothetical protein